MNNITRLAQAMAARDNLEARDERTEHVETMQGRWNDMIAALVDDMPSGSGIDIKPVLTDSNPERIAVYLEFHHMDEAGGYDGWTRHRVTFRPSFVHGIDIRVSGPNRNGILEYLAETFHSWATSDCHYTLADFPA